MLEAQREGTLPRYKFVAQLCKRFIMRLKDFRAAALGCTNPVLIHICYLIKATFLPSTQFFLQSYQNTVKLDTVTILHCFTNIIDKLIVVV